MRSGARSSRDAGASPSCRGSGKGRQRVWSICAIASAATRVRRRRSVATCVKPWLARPHHPGGRKATRDVESRPWGRLHPGERCRRWAVVWTRPTDRGLRVDPRRESFDVALRPTRHRLVGRTRQGTVQCGSMAQRRGGPSTTSVQRPLTRQTTIAQMARTRCKGVTPTSVPRSIARATRGDPHYLGTVTCFVDGSMHAACRREVLYLPSRTSCSTWSRQGPTARGPFRAPSSPCRRHHRPGRSPLPLRERFGFSPRRDTTRR